MAGKTARRQGAAHVTSRIAAALGGGYAATYAGTGALGVLVPLQPAEAVYLAASLCFLLYVPLVLYPFAARDGVRAWGPAVVVTVAGALLWWMGAAR